MCERKNLARGLAKAVNEKPKVFIKKVQESFEKENQASCAAKVLLYSRQVEMDKIAENLGGKDEIFGQVFTAFLEM